MKHLGKLSFGLLALALTACSSEEPLPGGQDVESGEKDVYATLTLRLPSATRADDPQNPNGFEYGKDYENSVGKVIVVLTKKDTDGNYRFLTSAESDAQPNGTEDFEHNGAVVEGVNKVKYLLNFASKELTPNPLDKEDGNDAEILDNDKVYVFAYCNPTLELSKTIKGLGKGDIIGNTGPGSSSNPSSSSVGNLKTGSKNTEEIWQKNRFLMTNSVISGPVRIPNRQQLIEENGVPENPLKLGTVEVKRVVARFDFESTFNTIDGKEYENTFEINDIDGVHRMGKVRLTEMAMFNIAKEYFYLPRTSSEWKWSQPFELCGNLDFVVSPNRGGFKTKEGLTLAEGKSNFFYYLIDQNNAAKPENLDWDPIAEWSKGTDTDYDNDEGWTASSGTNYRIWRYATENTIPAANSTNITESLYSQKVGITTGVVFKGVFEADDEKTWDGDNAIYVHNNKVYGSFKQLKEYVDKYGDSQVAEDFKVIDELNNAVVEEKMPVSLLKGVEDKKGFTVYEPNEDKQYVMYYFYYNRHDSNFKDSVLDENEFGVVRNNVYKLKVTKVGTLGTPDFPNDPDEPDEKENAYFTVDVVVMPWTVRVNNIQF